MNVQSMTIAVLAALIVVIFVSLPHPLYASTEFAYETVDAAGDKGQGYTSLAIDALGNPHISYYDETNRVLRYASKRGGVWDIENVDDIGSVYTSLAIDTQGNPHITYTGGANSSWVVRYARKYGDTWVFENVSPGTGGYGSLALDAENNPSICYESFSDHTLKYARKVGGIWTIETVDASGSAGHYCSLALDVEGGAHISYQDNVALDLKYAHKVGGVWDIETVESVGAVGNFTSLAVDGEGNPHIAHFDYTNRDLRYAVKRDEVWSSEVVDGTYETGYWPGITVDDQGNPHISYLASATADLMYARKRNDAWSIDVVDAAGDVGLHSSLVLDRHGRPCISYCDYGNRDLKYAQSGLLLQSPSGGETWPVGSLRAIEWSGIGAVDVLLSVDGGYTYQVVEESVIWYPLVIRVPHAPTRFARMRLLRESPFAYASSDTFFTISSEIILESFKAQPKQDRQGGVALTWATDPGPEDLSGYKLEKRTNGSAIWTPVVDLTKETAYQDNNVDPGTTYRLFGVNGWGDAYYLGEASVPVPTLPLRAWPLPYRGGNMEVTFQTASGLGGAPGQASVKLYDLQGRLVRTLVSGPYPSGTHRVTWDGRDEIGNPAATGIYMLNLMTGGEQRTLKVAVVR